MASESGSARPIEVDLSKLSLGKPPLWSQAWFIPLEIFGWFGFLLLLAAAGGNGRSPLLPLAGILALLTVLLIGVGFVQMMLQRASSTTTGHKVPFLKPGDAGVMLPGFDRPVSEILAMLQVRQAGGPGPVPRPTGPISAHALAYYVGGVAILAIGFPLFMVIRLGGAVPVMLLIGSAILMFTRARRVQLRGAADVTRDDPRPPILFLRSFRDDTINLMQRVRIFGLEPEQRIRFEEALSFMVGGYGPFLAVGEPGEGLPQLGAARAYLSDDAWQAQVLDWIARSQVITMLCGPTRWVGWEMKNIVAAGQLNRLLLFLPPGRRPRSQAERRRIERWDNIVKSLEDTPYGPALKALNIDDVLLILFRPGDQLMVFRSSGDAVQDYELAANLALHTVLNTPGSAAPMPVPTPAPFTPPAPHPEPVAGVGADPGLLAKMAGFGVLESVVGSACTMASPKLAILGGLVLFPIFMGVTVRLLISRDARIWGWVAGLCLAAAAVSNLAARTISMAMLEGGMEQYRRMAPVLGLMWPVLVMGALALRFRGFRHPLPWGLAVGGELVAAVLGFAIGTQLMLALALVRIISAGSVAAAIGQGLGGRTAGR